MRKAKLPKRELETCQRFRFARENILEITQASCAEQIGLDRSTVANYESGRTPLRYDVALRFCRQFIISEEWLATGKHDACHAEAVRRGELIITDWEKIDREIYRRQCLDLLSQPASLHIKPGTLFTKAYDETLAVRYAELLREFYYTPFISRSDADSPNIGINFLKAVHERHLILLDNEAVRFGFNQTRVWRLYVRRIFECSHLIFRKIMQLETGAEMPREVLEPFEWLRAISNDPAWPIDGPLPKVSTSAPSVAEIKPEKETGSDLTLSSTSTIDQSVKEKWPALKQRLQQAASDAKSRSKLIKFLGVDTTRISQWLTDSKNAREPGAEYALKMLLWVEQQERQPK